MSRLELAKLVVICSIDTGEREEGRGGGRGRHFSDEISQFDLNTNCELTERHRLGSAFSPGTP